MNENREESIPKFRCPLCNQPAYSIHEKKGDDGLGGYWVCGTCDGQPADAERSFEDE